MNRIAVIGIIVEEPQEVEKLNQLLHEYGSYIIGRMGIPYRERKIHVISIAMDAPQDTIKMCIRDSLEGQPVERLFYRDQETVCPHPDDIPFLNQQTRIVLENCGKIDAESIDEYIAAGGYQAPVSYTHLQVLRL